MRLVEQPEARSTSEKAREGGAAALTCRELTDGHLTEALDQAQPLQGRLGLWKISGDRPRPEPDVLLHRQVLVEEGLVGQETDQSPDRAAVPAEVVAEHHRLALDHPAESGADPEQRALPGPVRTLEMHDLPRGDVQVDPGERGEPADEGDRFTEVDDGLHDRKRVSAPPRPSQVGSRIAFPA